MNAILLDRINSVATEAIRRGYDFPSDFYANAHAYSDQDLLEFYRELVEFVAFERGYSAGLRNEIVSH